MEEGSRAGLGFGFCWRFNGTGKGGFMVERTEDNLNDNAVDWARRNVQIPMSALR